MENNWTIPATKELFSLVEQANTSGKGLSHAFEKMSEKYSRSVGSIRNYYYSQLKMFQLVPSLAHELGINVPRVKRDNFRLFGQSEIKNLMESILIGKAAGKSVRAVIAELSMGDAKTALRLQNKYRSMLTHHRSYVEEIMTSLKERGVSYYDPYRKTLGGDNEDNIKKLTEYISKLDEQEAGSFLKLIRKLM